MYLVQMIKSSLIADACRERKLEWVVYCPDCFDPNRLLSFRHEVWDHRSLASVSEDQVPNWDRFCKGCGAH